jgi:hypothetical protein
MVRATPAWCLVHAASRIRVDPEQRSVPPVGSESAGTQTLADEAPCPSDRLSRLYRSFSDLHGESAQGDDGCDNPV